MLHKQKQKKYYHLSNDIKCIIERYCRNLGILLPTLVRPHPVIQQFCVPERKSSLFEARVARAMVEPRGMGELSSRTAMSLGNPALDPLYWGCCGRIRDVLALRSVLSLECVHSKTIKLAKECTHQVDLGDGSCFSIGADPCDTSLDAVSGGLVSVNKHQQFFLHHLHV